ncbi:MAG: DNA-binding response OmpR family regulator [Candidatus Aldehydirespiratoraceae bacterium]|jgi:DNA-binding response OmpR family regulator
MTKSRLLVVEDDDRIRSSLRLALGDEGYTVDAVADAELGFQHFSDEPPDLVLVDVMLPGMNGLDLCHKIRQTSAVPIIVVTARDDSHDIVAGLEAGADDYVTKPFVFKELAARIRALLRRTQGLLPGEDGGAVEFGELSINVEEGTVERAGLRRDLTRTEFLLLCALVENERRILSRDQLLSTVWGYDYYGDSRIVDAHIRRLRKKIEVDPANPEYVMTVRGLGYKFDPEKPG